MALVCLTSCSPNIHNLKVYVDNQYCNIEGLNDSYSYNSEVKLKIKPINKYFLVPTEANVGVYGVDEYQYDVFHGELSFRITRDTSVRLVAEPIYGDPITYNQMRFYNYAEIYGDVSETGAIQWTQADFVWDFSSVTDETSKSLLFAKLKTLGLDTSDLLGQATVEQAPETNEYFSYMYKDSDLIKFFPDESHNTYFGEYVEPGIKSTRHLFSMYQLKYAPFVKPDEEEVAGKPTTPAFIAFNKINDNDQAAVCDLKIDFASYDIGDGHLIDGYLDIHYDFSSEQIGE